MSDSASSVSVFTGAFYIFILMSITGILMIWMGGTVIDRIFTGIDSAGLYVGPNMPVEWQQAQLMWHFFGNLFYFIGYLMPFLGLIIWISSIVKRTESSRYVQQQQYR